MQSVAGAAAGALRMRDKNGAEAEWGEAEREVVDFEANCNLVDTRQFRGLKRIQVEVWLLFEDQSSSVYAKVRSRSRVPFQRMHADRQRR